MIPLLAAAAASEDVRGLFLWKVEIMAFDSFITKTVINILPAICVEAFE